MLHLAQTVWPRFGYDQANCSLSPVSGPHTAPTWRKIPLPVHHSVRSPDKETISGVVVAPDETLRVCHAGMLSAVTLEGTILWQVALGDFIPEDERFVYSLPTMLKTGETLLTLPDRLLIVDRLGNIQRNMNRLAPENVEGSSDIICGLDDSGFSPNLTYSGIPVLSKMAGEVYVLKEDLWHEIGVYGYDIVTPAIYPDNSLAIAGYAGAGFCRVNLDGEKQWSTNIRMADKLPILNREQIAAVGSDDGYSAFIRLDGTQIGEYPASATFAECIDGGWIALSKQRLARLTTEGQEVWGCEISRMVNLTFVEQPIVDRDGFIFVRHQEGYLCCDADGRVAFNVQLPHPPQGLMSIIAPGAVAYAVEDELFIGHS